MTAKLIEAIRGNMLDEVSRLLEEDKADPTSAISDSGFSVVHLAAYLGHANILRFVRR